MWRPRVDHGQKHELRDATQSVRDGHPRPDYRRSRILRLALLAAAIVEAILDGTAEGAEVGRDAGEWADELGRAAADFVPARA
jgi:hypothetical protein